MRYLRVCTTGLQNPMLRDASEHRRGGITLPRQSHHKGDGSRLQDGVHGGRRRRLLQVTVRYKGGATHKDTASRPGGPGCAYFLIGYTRPVISRHLPPRRQLAYIQRRITGSGYVFYNSTRGDSNSCGLRPRVFVSTSVRFSQWGSGTQGGMVSTS